MEKDVLDAASTFQLASCASPIALLNHQAYKVCILETQDTRMQSIQAYIQAWTQVCAYTHIQLQAE